MRLLRKRVCSIENRYGQGQSLKEERDLYFRGTWMKGRQRLRKRRGRQGQKPGATVKEPSRKRFKKNRAVDGRMLARSTEKVPVSSGNMEGFGRTSQFQVSLGVGTVGGGRMNGRREVNVDGPGHREGHMEVPF